MKIYILHLRQDNIVTHIGHHGCVYDIISTNVWEGTQSNTEGENLHNTLPYIDSQVHSYKVCRMVEKNMSVGCL